MCEVRKTVMWCERPDYQSGSKEKIKDYITYFEGTCELCIGNMGIQKYLADIDAIIQKEAENDDEMNMLVFYVAGVIRYKIGEYDDATANWNKAEKYARRLTNDIFLAKIFSDQVLTLTSTFVSVQVLSYVVRRQLL